MGTIFERWQQVEHQLATEDRVHAFYRGCEALWDLKLDQFQQQLDALIDEERRSVAGPPRVSRAPPNCAPPGAARPPVKRWKPIALQNVLDSVQPLPLPPADRPGAGLTSVLRGIVQALDATAAQLHRDAEHFRALGRHDLARRALQVIFDASSSVRSATACSLQASHRPPRAIARRRCIC